MLPEEKNNQRTKLCLLLGIVLLLCTPILWQLKSKVTAAKTLTLSPVITASQENSDESTRSITYYITMSQNFLGKARELANTDSEQTPEEKDKILKIINSALDMANQAIALYPHDARGFAQRAAIYRALTPFQPQATKFALNDLTEAADLNKQNPEYRLEIAKIYQADGNFAQASLSFYNAHVLSPNNTDILLNLAQNLERSGQLTQAKYYYEQLVLLVMPDDQGLPMIKDKIKSLEQLLAQAKQEYLTDPGTPLRPDYVGATLGARPIMGTENLPLEEAAIANKVIIAGDKEAIATQNAKVDLNAKTGEAVILAGQTEILVKNHNVAVDKSIILTPIGATQNRTLTLGGKKANSTQEEGWFRVSLDKAATIDIKFSWWIVD